jgi:hypothetical protein
MTKDGIHLDSVASKKLIEPVLKLLPEKAFHAKHKMTRVDGSEMKLKATFTILANKIPGCNRWLGLNKNV